MIENTTPDLLNVFIGRQNIDNRRLDDDGNIRFDLSVLDTENEKTSTPRLVKRSDLENIENFFASTLQSCPFAKHLLQVLWIREVKFAMGVLKDEEVYSFIQRAVFTLYNIDLDADTAEHEFLELLDEGFLQETNTGFLLATKGKCIAEEIFKTIGVVVPDHTDSLPIAVRDNGAIDVINKLKDMFERPTPVYLTDKIKPFTEQDLPDESKGFWESQKDFAERKKITIKTLRKYRETGSGAESLPNGMIRDSQHNILKPESDKKNSSFLYFVNYESSSR